MQLTINKKFEFAAAHKLYRHEWTAQQNTNFFGEKSHEQGHGHNFTFFLSCAGPVQDKDGMVMELSQLKTLIQNDVLSRYDHFFLNSYTEPFNTKNIQPTVENIAAHLLNASTQALSGTPLSVKSVHLIQKPNSEATAYFDNRLETHVNMFIPSLPFLLPVDDKPAPCSASFNLRISLGFPYDPYASRYPILENLQEQAVWAVSTVTTSAPQSAEYYLTRWWEAINTLFPTAPLVRLKLSSFNDYFWEYEGKDEIRVGHSTALYAGHVLAKQGCKPEENFDLFGPCARYHGHTFIVEPTFRSSLTSPLPAPEVFAQFKQALKPFQYRSLSHDIGDLKGTLATCEHLIFYFYEAFKSQFPSLCRLRLTETPNNRFTLRV
jgi:6-pyruvoyltetrahydropterin/6-carboxytetrahydropterin synthase